MPTLADSISKLKIDGKTFNNPQWWSSTHKITRQVKKANEMKDLYRKYIGKINLKTSYKIVTVDEIPRTDIYIKRLRQDAGNVEFNTFAPWNSIFNKYKTLIMFDK